MKIGIYLAAGIAALSVAACTPKTTGTPETNPALETIFSRTSIRTYQDRTVEPQKIELLLRATMSDDADPLLFLESDDGLFFHREGVSPDLPRKLYRGKFTVEAHVDLHGLTVDEARDTVAAFLSENQARNHRCVRIVHGKGYGSVGGQSILKELVRRWLKQRREVMCFVEAPPNDGGGGAVLVLLSQAPRR